MNFFPCIWIITNPFARFFIFIIKYVFYKDMAKYTFNKTQLRKHIKSLISEAICEIDDYDHPEQSNGNQFAGDYRNAAHKFAHNGVDAYFARKDQDAMHDKEKRYMKQNTKRAMDAADKRPLHRKGSLNRALESKTTVTENIGGRYVFHCHRPSSGNDAMVINDLNKIKPFIGNASYWDVTKGDNSSEVQNLVAWGGRGGYWANIVENPNTSPEERNFILSKRKEVNSLTQFESKINNIVKQTIKEALESTDDDDYDDDAEFHKREAEDEMNYDMQQFAKAMQKANGTYQATSSDGQWKTGDKVRVVSKRAGEIVGTIKDFGENFMTWEEDCDIDYIKDGQTWTLVGVPLNRLERVGNTNESKRINEEWYPEGDEGMDDYYFGSIMTLDVEGVFDDLTPEKVQELNNIGKDGNGPYIENEQKYSSVMVRKVNVVPDGFDGYDVSVEVAVSSPDMPHDAIEDEVEEMVWYWIEEQTGVRSPRVFITDEKPVFDRRSKNK